MVHYTLGKNKFLQRLCSRNRWHSNCKFMMFLTQLYHKTYKRPFCYHKTRVHKKLGV